MQISITSIEDTNASGCSCRYITVEWNHHRNCTIWREHARARQEFCHPNRGRWLCCSLFWELTKEDAIAYQDWCSKTEEALEKGYDPVRVKEAMFTSLEGMAKDNAKMIDKHLHVTRILDRLDSMYGVSMTSQLLNTALCCLHQKPFEVLWDYYSQITHIVVILLECHWNHY